MDNRTEPIAAGVWRLEVATLTNAYVVARDALGDRDGLILVDAGTRAAPPRLVRSLRLLGLDPRAVDEVVCTHWHADHAGGATRLALGPSAPSLAALSPDAEVIAGAAEPATGRRTPLARALARVSRRPTPAPTSALCDGERLDGGLVVVAAPGHTVGQAAIWLPERGALLAGDAVLTAPRLWTGPRALTADLDAVPATLARLAALGPGVVGPGHGPPLRRRAAERLEALAERAARRVR